MKTNIELNDKLIQEAMKLTDIRVKKHVIDLALEELVKNRKQRAFGKYFGKVTWEGDIRRMREV